jgi:hypothetical protein
MWARPVKARPTIFVDKLKLAEIPCGRFFYALALPATFLICVNHDICQAVNVQAEQSYFLKVARPRKYDIRLVTDGVGQAELKSLSATPLEAQWVADRTIVSTDLERPPAHPIVH